MNALWLSATLLGAAGSAHCIGMCGPIALAVPTLGPGPRARAASTLLLNSGRLLSYALLGFAFGTIGRGLRLVGLQQSVSITIGLVLLLAAFVPAILERASLQSRLSLWLSRLRGLLARHLRRRSPEAIWFSGMLNGLLPCGLVYTAALGSTTAGNAWDGAMTMFFFGLGTLPALFAVRLSASLLTTPWRARLRKASPFVVGAMGLLLLIRGSGAGIPYLSPAEPTFPYALNSCD